MPKTLTIVWSKDTHNCEYCGFSFASGARVLLDDVVIIDEPAAAHCFNGPGPDFSKVATAVLNHLGIEVRETEADLVLQGKDGFLISWDDLEGENRQGKMTYSRGARAWLNGKLVFDKPADIEADVYVEPVEVFRAALVALDLVLEESNEGDE